MDGHRDFKTTLIYADYSPSEREREWVEAAFSDGRSQEREQHSRSKNSAFGL